jgi:hypothetical protein
MTKEIPLTQGQVAIVDDWRYEELNQFKWYATRIPHMKSFYAARYQSILFGKRTTIFMHTVIAGTPKGAQTDHWNHDTLDNREENLRVCTYSENGRNRGKQKNNTSGFKGVTADGQRWRARIALDEKYHCIGTYDTPEEAARVYDESAKELHGEFASLNFPR